MRVYVVIELGDYDCGDDVKGVFSDMATAQATRPGEWEHVQWEHDEYWLHRDGGYRIEEHEVK